MPWIQYQPNPNRTLADVVEDWQKFGLEIMRELDRRQTKAYLSGGDPNINEASEQMGHALKLSIEVLEAVRKHERAHDGR